MLLSRPSLQNQLTSWGVDNTSKRHKQMDKHFQIWNIKRCLKCCGVIFDTIDSEALIDSKLYYPENEINILKIIGVIKYDKYR